MNDTCHPARLDYGLTTFFGQITKTVNCEVGLETVADDPYRFTLCVKAPVPDDLDQAKIIVIKVEGRTLQGTVRHVERRDDDSLKLEVEPD
ncbi:MULTISPECIES: hypothetical protein [unclassified Pseudomonas]|uniref:hypothetical protein n=1 Tax=unclassified Pseudomonas TaxID=196821 RepID=UPI00164782DC|nr:MULTISPECIES: hypothetical protein [unclassified Pseudomonas]MBC3208184.1 hypothetical protein [Pseudomonas sp. SWRI111]MBC3779296.1 hypothetical protein [Pseudomonas sp. SWRI99]